MIYVDYTAPILTVTSKAAPSAGAVGLDTYRWRSRALIVSTASSEDPAFRIQRLQLESNVEGLRDRDIVVIQVIGDRANASDGSSFDAKTLRQVTRLATPRFGLVLIGKDGGEKLKRFHPVSIQEIFSLVDAMPMRQDEMRQQGG